MAADSSNTNGQLQLLAKGGPFKVAQVLKPSLEPDQVLVRQKVATLNPMDWKQRDFGVAIPHYPHVLGVEGAGVVEAVGHDVHGLQPGDEVMEWATGLPRGEPWGGSFQQYMVLPARFAPKKPQNISIEDAASLPICYTTAISALVGLNIPLPNIPKLEVSGPIPSSVLVLGGASAVGAATIQLLRIALPSLPILATSSPKHHEHLTTLGANKVFDYHSEALVADIRASSPDSNGVDAIIDCVGSGASETEIFETLSREGTRKYAAVVTGSEVKVPADVSKFDVTGLSILGMQGGEYILPALTELVEQGNYKIPLPVVKVGHGLEGIPSVLDQVKSVSGKKLVVTL